MTVWGSSAKSSWRVETSLRIVRVTHGTLIQSHSPTPPRKHATRERYARLLSTPGGDVHVRVQIENWDRRLSMQTGRRLWGGKVWVVLSGQETRRSCQGVMQRRDVVWVIIETAKLVNGLFRGCGRLGKWWVLCVLRPRAQRLSRHLQVQGSRNVARSSTASWRIRRKVYL